MPTPTKPSRVPVAAEDQRRPDIPSNRQTMMHYRFLIGIEDSLLPALFHEAPPAGMPTMRWKESARFGHAPRVLKRWRTGPQPDGPQFVPEHISKAQDSLERFLPALQMRADVDSEATMRRSLVCR
jgi:hypothetical protein